MKVELSMIDPDSLLIIRHKTGIVYTNQAGGLMCLHPEVEGYAVPVNWAWGKVDQQRLHALVCGDELGEADLDAIDKTLPAFLKIDRARASELVEAWIPVRVTIKSKDMMGILDGMTGILTYENCD